ncbi:hypothetical protein HYPSUDRAFT_210337 [Hypholoma sublateritium FD-334 SS-4]|uniref:Uncharacterized protein n=1 Tax=Hypholoma sublateritium (strain FD-334 SS-4) TaxID=945553 RepID=A0A0D2LP77_HYPSF|nr:hypothetical protein HYPSUDRAFT_210337 [Hypholoma sublateritium FD-334 SS-4]
MSQPNSFEEAWTTGLPPTATATSAGASTTTTSSAHISAIFGPAGSSAATEHPHVKLNNLGMDQRVLNLLVANEKMIRDQRNEILQIRAKLLRMQIAQQENLPATTAPSQLAHGIDPDATIVLPSRRRNIGREDTILFDAMDIL